MLQLKLRRVSKTDHDLRAAWTSKLKLEPSVSFCFTSGSLGTAIDYIVLYLPDLPNSILPAVYCRSVSQEVVDFPKGLFD